MDTDKLIERLNFHNPWWLTGSVPPGLLHSFHRHIYPKIESYLKLDRVVLLKGPRRTGKSTIFFQLIDKLLREEKVNPKDILYLTFDDPALRLDLFEILKTYERFTSGPLNEVPIKYIFLDEVHFLSDWAAFVKVFYDKKLPIKILGSGSSASLLIKQSESLGGRTIEETVLPLSFPEWRKYYRGGSSIFGQTEELEFRSYLTRSGFMHLLDIPQKELWTKMIVEDVVTKAIYKDAVEIFGLREPAVLEKLFSYLSASTGGIANILKLSSMLGVDRVQVSKYLSFLENSLLIFSLKKYSPRIRETLRSQEKIHLTDQGFGQVYLPTTGAILESVVARHVWEKFPKNTYFWREKYEVDLVLDRGQTLIPVEVKESSKPDTRDLKGILSFAAAYKQKEGIVVYLGPPKEVTVDKIKISFIPAWKYLLDLFS